MVRNEKKMIMFFVSRFILPVSLCLFLCLASCNLKSNQENSFSISFGKIYNKSDTSSYTALDIKQTPGDGGYIILAEVDGYPYLLKVEKDGKFSWDSKDKNIFEYYKYPIAELLTLNSAYYFFCRKEKDNEKKKDNEGYDWDPVLVKVRKEEKEDKINVDVVTKIEFDNPFPPFKFRLIPIHANLNSENNFLVLVADNWGTQMSFIGKENSNTSWKVDGASHWNRYECVLDYPSTDKRFHYTGRLNTKGTYYFQTFTEYISDFSPPPCFSIRMEAPKEDSDIHPDLFLDRPLIAMEWNDSQWNVSNWDGNQWDGLKLSYAAIDNDMVYFAVNSRIKVEKKIEIIYKVENGEEIEEELEISILKLEEGQPQLELLASKPVYMMSMPVNGKEIVFFAGSTIFNNISLYAYDPVEKTLLNKDYFGDIRSFEAAGLIKTDDDGLAILGITYVMNRLKRICLFKLSKADVEEMCRQ